MFRRKDEAYDPNDLLSEVMNDSHEDITLDVGSNDMKNDNNPGASRPQNAPAASVAAAPAAPAAAMPASAASMPSAAAKPLTASAFRPQPAPAAMPVARSAAAPVAPVSTGSAVAETRSTAVSSAVKASKRVLTVGHDIHMKGEISTCDRLLIEGSVDAVLKDVHTVELTQSGSFKGTAEIEDAEISGHFEGDLIVNGRLTIYATGVVKGNVAYGEIEIERGGKLTGTIKTAEEMKGQQAQGAKKVA